MGLFDSADCNDCVDCSGQPQCFLITRRIGGFAEYVITQAKTNPVTYFTGRRYKKATYLASFTQSMTGYCAAGGFTLYVNPFFGLNNYSFSLSEAYAEYNNCPSVGQSGSDGYGNSFNWILSNFNPDGLYSWYDAVTFGLRAMGYVAAAITGAFDTGGSPNYSHIDFGTTTTVPVNPDTDGFGECTGTAANPGCQSAWFIDHDGCGFCACYGCIGGAGGTDGIDSQSNTANNGSITSSQYLGNAAANETIKGYGCLGGNPCELDRSYSIVWDANCSGTLSNEINYDGVHDSLLNFVNVIELDPLVSGVWSINDYPIQGGNWTLDQSLYDGNHASNDPAAYFATGFGVGYGNDFCAPPGSNIAITAPNVQHHYFSATWYLIGNADVPGLDYFDTHICAIAMKHPNLTTPYILVTYRVMNDYTYIYESCTAGAAAGAGWIPQPSAKGFASGLFTVDGGGNLVGPIGRITIMIPGTDCATWIAGGSIFPS